MVDEHSTSPAERERGPAERERGSASEPGLDSTGTPYDPAVIEGSELEPMTLSLMGRFFGVPLLIISVIVGGAVAVVLLFGGPATERARPVSELLATLEASSGARSMGILLPREKELWQAALELSQRLKHRDTELTPEELDETADRLAEMIRVDLARKDQMVSEGSDRITQSQLRTARLRFLIHALGRTETPVALETLLGIIRANQEPFVSTAMQELGETPSVIGSTQVIETVANGLASVRTTEAKLVGCTVLSVLAEPHDERAIEVLSQIRLAHDGEVAWSAALALARLGSANGRTTLMDLLDREFLESPDLYIVRNDEGSVVGRYPLPPARVEATLIAAIQAAAHLDDAELWAMIRELQSDPSLAVRGAASEAVGGRSALPSGDTYGAYAMMTTYEHGSRAA
jgi:hypothetical protein